MDGAPEAAVRNHLRAAQFDERLLPAQFFGPEEYLRISRRPDLPAPIEANEAVQRFAGLLPKWRRPDAPKATSLSQALAPVGPDDVPELWRGLRELDLSPQLLPDLAALSYALTGLDSYDWIASDTIGYVTLIPQMIEQGRPMNGVVCRVREAGQPKPWMLFMFWSNEGTSALQKWQLVSLTPVPTE